MPFRTRLVGLGDPFSTASTLARAKVCRGPRPASQVEIEPASTPRTAAIWRRVCPRVRRSALRRSPRVEGAGHGTAPRKRIKAGKYRSGGVCRACSHPRRVQGDTPIFSAAKFKVSPSSRLRSRSASARLFQPMQRSTGSTSASSLPLGLGSLATNAASRRRSWCLCGGRPAPHHQMVLASTPSSAAASRIVIPRRRRAAKRRCESVDGGDHGSPPRKAMIFG